MHRITGYNTEYYAKLIELLAFKSGAAQALQDADRMHRAKQRHKSAYRK